MTDTGMSRRIDELGRVVIPKEIRKSLAIRPGDELGISVNRGVIVLTPKRIRCLCCGKTADMLPADQDFWQTPTGNRICPQCVEIIRRTYK